MVKSLALAVMAIAAAWGAATFLRTSSNAGPAGASPQIVATTPAGRFDGRRAFGDLEALVAIGPRPAGSAQIRQARAYITRQLSALGLSVQEQPFTATTPLGRVEMANLIVRLPGRRTDRLLFAGHYDTKLFRDQVFVGASDGGSSAAFLIELARVLTSRQMEYTTDLVWFDGEEAVLEWVTGGTDHTYGSRFYVQQAQKAGTLASIKALVLVDMIADRDLMIRRDVMSTPWLTDLIWAAARRIGHDRTFVDATTEIDDDHIPFIRAGVPAVDIIDLDYPAWHTPQDDLDHVSAASLQVVGDVVLAALPDLEQRLSSGPPRP
jgi:glutaminyl-peptide cyclotransferase